MAISYTDYLIEHAPIIRQEEWNNWIALFPRPEYLIHQFSEYLDWELVLKYQKLSEEFIREHIFYLKRYKDKIFMYQKISEDFKRELGYD